MQRKEELCGEMKSERPCLLAVAMHCDSANKTTYKCRPYKYAWMDEILHGSNSKIFNGSRATSLHKFDPKLSHKCDIMPIQ